MIRLILFLIPVLLPTLSAKAITLLVLKHPDSPHTANFDLTQTITNLPENATILYAMETAQNSGKLSFTSTQDEAHGALVTEIDGVAADWDGKQQYWELWVEQSQEDQGDEPKEEQEDAGPRWDVERMDLVRASKGVSRWVTGKQHEFVLWRLKTWQGGDDCV